MFFITITKMKRVKKKKKIITKSKLYKSNKGLPMAIYPKLLPQPQEDFVFGFLNVKPVP